MVSTEINLIKRGTTGALGVLAQYEERLRVFALWFSFGLLTTGILIGSLFMVIHARFNQLQNRKLQLVARLNDASAKEGIIISLKQRIVLAQKALDAARPWGKLFPLLGQIAPVSQFSTVTVDDGGRVNTILEVNTIDEAVSAVTNTVGLFQNKLLRAPQLLSLSLRDTGTVQVALSFIPIF